ncbi:MAG: TRAP transporter small permease [Paracoccus sp. (in: a-proteobacteria)]|uniref:TRAP transporter small permease n=1 Tax=Paracoccus sp. TaxID=267 RepID=UPI0026DF02A0|nr:TRAP transporter small permease [Paracoccus sp. (in: a-proteobacteria)]MDO5620336.1 TRAP transporter small permease [Paracoccus sp. (in: a-proteobacteria)]
MKAIETTISRASIVLGSFVLMAMMLQVVVDVISRKVLGAGFPATADLVGKYYMVAVSFLPLAMTEVHRRHIEATIFTQRLHGLPRKIVFLFGFVLALVVFCLLTKGSFDEAMKQTARGAYVDAGTMRFPTWPSYWILPVSFALMALVLVLRIIEILTGRFDDEDNKPVEDVQHNVIEVR